MEDDWASEHDPKRHLPSAEQTASASSSMGRNPHIQRINVRFGPELWSLNRRDFVERDGGKLVLILFFMHARSEVLHNRLTQNQTFISAPQEPLPVLGAGGSDDGPAEAGPHRQHLLQRRAAVHHERRFWNQQAGGTLWTAL